MTKILPARYRFARNTDGSYSVDIPAEERGRITGTLLAGVVNRSMWTTPFAVACAILNIFGEDISDKPSVNAGKILEEPILRYMNESGILANIPAVKELEQGEHNDWVQNFEHPIFGGHFDARTPEGHIVEVKTTSHPEQWIDANGNRTVPEYYWLQASLYAHFLNTDVIHFVVAGMNYESIYNPYSFVPSSVNTITFEVPVHPELDSILATAEEWYHEYIENNKTPVPDMSNPIDRRIVSILEAQSKTNESMQDLLSQYEDVKARQAELDAQKKQVDKDAEILEEQLRMYLNTHEEGVSSLKNYYHIVKSSRKSVDTNALKKDGLYDKYAKTSETQTLKVEKLIG